ncbi:hypothetical protein CC86DRAFT_367163 [Ophiobolus disseminans]|uniref:N-acetyltransferase domain-containing protein n=1 Tax=Ophiobolus disseminans TaxID=1469910 RepID=A0A6A7ACI8_9PLEO|nr:hypothetical protein CC86DRAFT_367163 [Ophiobolus disseminans]
MALWDVYLTSSTWRRPEISWLTGEERKRADSLISPLWDAREQFWLDKRYLYCHVIAVHPDYQRKGVGQLLMDFGIGVAQKAELPIYIESSQEGVRLYEKLGCRRLKEPRKYGPDAVESLKANGVEGDSEVALFVWIPNGVEWKLPNNMELA